MFQFILVCLFNFFFVKFLYGICEKLVVSADDLNLSIAFIMFPEYEKGNNDFHHIITRKILPEICGSKTF